MLRKRTQERVEWLLKYIAATHFKSICGWDEETVDDFVEAFPEAEKSLVYYTLGPNSSPTLNRTANIAHKLGYLRASSLGNMDARSFNKKTWCRYWSLTDKGKAFIATINATVGEQNNG